MTSDHILISMCVGPVRLSKKMDKMGSDHCTICHIFSTSLDNIVCITTQAIPGLLSIYIYIYCFINIQMCDNSSKILAI